MCLDTILRPAWLYYEYKYDKMKGGLPCRCDQQHAVMEEKIDNVTKKNVCLCPPHCLRRPDTKRAHKEEP